MPKVYFFSIGGRKYGFGHIARSIPIYDRFAEEKYDSIFVVYGDNTVDRVLKNRNYVVKNWIKDGASYLKSDDIVVIDTLKYPVQFISSIKSITNKVFFINDDDDFKTNDSTKVINWGVGTKNHVDESGVYGYEYVPIRNEIKKFRKKTVSDAQEVIITMGSNDVRNIVVDTVKLLIHSYPNLHINALVKDEHDLRYLTNSFSSDKVTPLFKPVTQHLMGKIQDSGFAIASGGHSIYEYAYIGTPVIHVLIIDNQKPALKWNETNFTYPMGWYNENDYEEKVIKGVKFFSEEANLKNAFQGGQKMIDGEGAKRIVKYIIAQL